MNQYGKKKSIVNNGMPISQTIRVLRNTARTKFMTKEKSTFNLSYDCSTVVQSRQRLTMYSRRRIFDYAIASGNVFPTALRNVATEMNRVIYQQQNLIPIVNKSVPEQ